MKSQGYQSQNITMVRCEMLLTVLREESAGLCKWKPGSLMRERDLISITPNVCPFL